MGDYAGICPCDDGNSRLARDWYQRLNAELTQALHTEIAYIDDATPATRANILTVLVSSTAELVLYFGHSTVDEWTRKGIATVDRTNVSAAKGKAIVSVSCKSGRNLGPNAVNSGGVTAWLGFTISVPVIAPYGTDDPIGDAIVRGLAALDTGTMAGARAALETEIRQVAADYDTGGRFQNHPNALLGYFAAGWLADNVSLSGATTLAPLAAHQQQPSGSTGPQLSGSAQQPSASGVGQPKSSYHWVLHMSGDEPSNGAFLTRIKSFQGVEAQTRFIVPGIDGEVRIAAWSSEPYEEIVFHTAALKTATKILSIEHLD
jgi:hypothetical protein